MPNSTQPQFASPVHTSLDELVSLQSLAAFVSSRKRRTAARQQGTAPSKHFGRGLDFAEVREYHAGDEVRMMDWNVTARTGRAHIKVFMEERERPVLFLVDQTSSMNFGTKGMFKRSMAVRLAAVLSWCALSDGDRIGGVVALPEHVLRIKPVGQRRGILRLLQALASTSTDAPPNAMMSEHTLLRSLQQIRILAPSGSRVVLISDFLNIDESIEQEISGLLKRVEITPICVQDALEHTLPTRGLLPVRSKEMNGPAAVLDVSTSAQGAHAARAAYIRAHIDQMFSKGGQAVTHVQSHQQLAEVAMQAWFGVRSQSPSAAETHG